MQIIGLHKNVYRFYAWARTQECLDAYRIKYEDNVRHWETLRAEGVSEAKCAEFVGISRSSYYRRKRVLRDLAQGITPPSKAPKHRNKPQWGEAEKQLVLCTSPRSGATLIVAIYIHPLLPLPRNHGDIPHMTNHPQRTAIYSGPITDSTRWDGFDMRATDVFICTPPKCGTTWSQGITCMMIQGTPDFDGNLTTISPWLESQTRPIAEMNEDLATQTHRRCIKSHSPMDGITYDPRVTYIAVYRHPLDVHFSMRNHVANMTSDKLDHLFPGDPRHDALMFINDTPPAWDCDHLTLDTFTDHYKSFKKWEDLPNVHLFHYADMRADLPAAMARFATILGYTFDDATMASLIQGAGFDAMRKNADRFAPSAGKDIFKNDAGFFKSASSGKWEKHLTKADMAQYSARMDQLLDAKDRHWLENGSSPELPAA